MIKETNLIDLSKVTLENYSTYSESIKYEVPRQWSSSNIKPKRKAKTIEEKEKAIKEYQHQYYLKVTKQKRKLTKEDKL